MQPCAQQRRVGGVLAHLPRELGNHLGALVLGGDGRFGGVAHVKGGHQLEPVGLNCVEEGRVVILGQPAVDAQHGGAHGLDERKVAQPDEGVLCGEVVAVGRKIDGRVDGRGRVADALDVKGLAADV